MITLSKHILILLFVTTLLAIVSTGCKNTAHGFGRDVEKAGDKIQEKAD